MKEIGLVNGILRKPREAVHRSLKKGWNSRVSGCREKGNFETECGISDLIFPIY
jgi:hypothetical protein